MQEYRQRFNVFKKNMKIKQYFLTLLLITVFIIGACKKEKIKIPQSGVTPDMKVTLGKNIFSDKNLSNPIGQSCSSCHSSATSFSDPEHNIVSPGAVSGLFGNRNAPIGAYAMFNPPFHFDNIDSSYVGGLFLDGRVNTLEEQAKKPFLNPLEMNNTDINSVVAKIKNASYYSLYQKIYGDIEDVNAAFNNIADAIATFERTPELNAFTSKYDYYLLGQASLTAQELSGLKLFNDTLKAKCGNCHLTTPDDISGKILFTDFTYNSDGVPKNSYNPFYTISSAFNASGANYIDLGLGAILNDHTHDGEFRVPSLRNVALSAPYFHNGVFGTLEEVVHFYNKRDVPGGGFAPPEVLINVDTLETGNLHLTAQEEADIVAFLRTLTDGYK